MSKLLKGWREEKLSLCVKSTKGKKPKILQESMSPGFTPYIDIKAFELGEIRKYGEISSSKLTTDKDILMVWDGARSGLVGRGFNGAIGSTIVALQPTNILKEYLYYFLSWKYDYINSNHKGTGIPHVDPDILWNIDVPLPPTIEQQKLIVDNLELLLGKINNANERLEKIPIILKRFRQSVLSAACSGRLTADWREGNEGGEWKNKLLNELCLDIVDCPHSTPKWTENGKICIRTTNFKAGILDLSEVRYVSVNTFIERTSRLTPMAGDILYSREGGILGIACQVPKNVELCMGQRMMLLRTKKAISSKYIMYTLNSPLITDAVIKKTGGTASPHINVGDVKKFIIPTPSIQEQEEIVRQVDMLFTLADKIKQRYKNAKALLVNAEKAIYAKAFRGELVNDKDVIASTSNIYKVKQAARTFGNSEGTDDTADLVKEFLEHKRHEKRTEN